MRIILDTNIIVSGLLTSPGVCQRIVDAVIRGEINLCLSAEVLAEYEDVLQRSRLKIPGEKVRLFLLFARKNIVIPSPQFMPIGLPDPDDEIFLAAAIAVKADFLVTGNLRHFPPHLRHGIRVVSPAEFLKVFSTTS